MKILILGKNGIKRKNWGHQLFLNTFSKYHDVIYFGEGHIKYDPLLSIPQVVDKFGKPDLILTYMAKRCVDFKGLEDIRNIKKAHIEIDFFPKKDGYAGQYDLNSRYNRFQEFFSKNKFNIMFATSSTVIKGLEEAGISNNVKFLPFGVNMDYFYDRNLNRDIDVMAVFSDPKYAYKYRSTIKNILSNNKKINTFTNKVKHENYINIINRSKISITSNNIYNSLGMRYTETLACNTLLLADRPEDIDKQGFKENEHFVIYTDLNDMKNKIDYYLKNEKKRIKIAKQGMEFVKNNHTTDIRIKQFTDIIQKELFNK